MLRIRSDPGNLTTVFTNSSAAYNIVYRTTDSNYKPSWAWTILLAPKSTLSARASTANSSAPALLSWLEAYDSPNVDQGPSATYYTTGSPFVDAALGRGWYVNVPDYEGPLASFTAGVQSGHAVIDSVRASLRSDCGLTPTAKAALWGYSGGSQAAELAAELQVQYAPELRFAGVAIGGVVANVTSFIETINESRNAFFSVNSLLGITTQDAVARRYLESQLQQSGPRNASTFLSAARLTFTEAARAFLRQNTYEYFTAGHAALEELQRLVYNRDGLMGYHGVPAAPMLAYHAVPDEIVPIGPTDRLVARYCEVGANVLYRRNAVGTHIAEVFAELETAFAFLSAVFDGSYVSKYSATGCTIEQVSVEAPPGTPTVVGGT